jgi:hypothetical protein
VCPAVRLRGSCTANALDSVRRARVVSTAQARRVRGETVGGRSNTSVYSDMQLGGTMPSRTKRGNSTQVQVRCGRPASGSCQMAKINTSGVFGGFDGGAAATLCTALKSKDAGPAGPKWD